MGSRWALGRVGVVMLPVERNGPVCVAVACKCTGVAKLGAGNWGNVNKHILTTKTRGQCEDHYWDSYMGQFGPCLPTTTILCTRDGTPEEVATEPMIKDDPERDVIRVPGIDRKSTRLTSSH